MSGYSLSLSMLLWLYSQADDLDIKESDLQITFQRASGAGGQNVSDE
jgi:protein subunit release factor B